MIRSGKPVHSTVQSRAAVGSDRITHLIGFMVVGCRSIPHRRWDAYLL